MKYTILDIRVQDDGTVTTNVQYDIDGEITSVSIPHFRPRTKEEIVLGIENRVHSEKDMKDSVVLANTVIRDIELNREFIIPPR